MNPSGAEQMVDEGVLDGVASALALHVDPTRPSGTVATGTGGITSATDAIVIDVHGRAGHSGRPFLARDAILAAADVIRTLATAVGQRANPLHPAVLNFGVVRGGEAPNVIADRVTLHGVLRTLHPDARTALRETVPELAARAAAVFGCGASTTWTPGSPSVVNDVRLHETVTAAAADVLGPSGVRAIDAPSTGAEDFGFFGAVVPQYMMRLGAGTGEGEVTHLHTPAFDIDERCIALGVRIMARAAWREAQRLAE